LGLSAVELDAKSSPPGADAEVAIAEATDEVEGLHRRLFEREPERVFPDGLLHRLAHVSRRLEVPIGRKQAGQGLVRPLEVVAVDEEREPLPAVVEVGEHRPGQKLVPQRLPESLHFAERLRMLRPALDVPNPIAPQLPLEVRLPTPGRVLPALVGEHLLGRPVLRDARGERLQDQLATLMVGQRPADDEAAVVVHEGRQVQPLLASEQEGEDVRLPELVRTRSLETSRRVLAMLASRRRLRHQPLLVKDLPHGRLTDADRFESREHVANAPRPPLGVLLPLLDDCPPPRVRTGTSPPGRDLRLRHQGVFAADPKGLHPLRDRRHRRSEHPRDHRQRGPLLRHLLDDSQPQSERVRHPRVPEEAPALPGASVARCTPVSLLVGSSLPSRHLRLFLSGSGVRSKERRTANQLRGGESDHQVARCTK